MTRNPPGMHLLFHGVGTPQRAIDEAERAYWISISQFEEVLHAFADVPGIAVSFDDSNSSDLNICLPRLRAVGLSATFFVLAGRFGQRGSLDAEDVRCLAAEGMKIGNHGMRHISWQGLVESGVQEELVTARHILEDAVGGPIECAALPFGRYDRRTVTRLRRLGYRTVSTSDRRPQRTDHFLHHRFSVRREDSPESLRLEFEASGTLRRRARNSAAGLVKRSL